MIIYPAIDLKSNRCVRLYQGQYEQVTIYEHDPIKLAQSFAQQGATWLHIVDLDGAKCGASTQLDLIFKIKRESGLRVQVGGGIRSKEQITNLLQNGIDRVILGSTAVQHANEIKMWLNDFDSEQIAVALDVRFDFENQPILAVHGWQVATKLNLWQLLDCYQESPLKHVLCTDIARDGTLLGCNIHLYQQCIEHYPHIEFQASGGIHALSDLQQLVLLPIAGAVIGKALYENKFSLPMALDEARLC